MRRVRPPVSLLLSLSLLVILAPSTQFVPRARACPISPPVPLRMLYKQSDRVVVATVGASVVAEREESYNTVRTLMNVSETLKGDADEYATYLYHDVWTGDGEESEATAEEDDYKFGNTLLLFLERRKEGGGYQLSDGRYGLKKLPEADLKVYVERIKELAALTRRGQPDDRELVEWLVRCAEQKATRWEGAYELAVSATRVQELEAPRRLTATEAQLEAAVQRGDFVVVQPAPAEATPADGANATKPGDAPAVTESSDAEQQAAPAEAVEPSEAANAVAETDDATSAAPPAEGGANGQTVVLSEAARVGFVGTDIKSRHAGMLTAEQKKRLASALFESDEIGEGETELLHVVETFKDERLAPFLLAYLRRLPEAPPENVGAVMSALARLRGDDKELTALAQGVWGANAYTIMQEEEVAEQLTNKGGKGAAEEAEEEEDLTPEQIRQQEEAYEARLKEAEKKAARRRAEMLRDFLARFDAPPPESP